MKALAGVLALLLWVTAHAQSAPGGSPAPPTAEQRHAEVKAALNEAGTAARSGPAEIDLIDEARLHLPAGRVWIPRAQASRLLRAWGNHPGGDLIGLVSGMAGGDRYFASVSFTRDGYVKDDDARDLDPEKLLASMREGAEQENQDRLARGFPAIAIDEWLQRPRYDMARKRLVWALPLRDVGEDAASATINYNTRALGRDGYLSLNLLTDRAHFDAARPEAETLLADLEYLPGKRYQDFNKSTDHVAAYGLAALIGVVALKKLGLIALGTAFVLKFAKLGIVAVLGIGAAVRRFLRGRGSVPRA